jgi:hypothetical protein
MNRNLIFIAITILLLAACQQQENENKLKAINTCIQKANEVIQSGNKLLYDAIDEKLKDPLTHDNASVWEPRATTVKKIADSINLVIENIKIQILKQSDSLRKPNAPIIKQLYETNGDGYVLLNKLVAFKESIPGIFSISDFYDKPYLAPHIKQDLCSLLDSIPVLPGFRGNLSETQRSVFKKKWVEENFAGSASLPIMIQLNKIQSEVLVTEQELISYFHNRIVVRAICGGPFPFAAINSSYVKSGQSITVTAGILQFNIVVNPRVTINGKEVKINSDGEAQYSFIAQSQPGKNIIPVCINYSPGGGSQFRASKNIEYIIADK